LGLPTAGRRPLVRLQGMDPHENWRQISLRRVAAQAVLWTLKLPVPKGGLPVKITEADLQLPEGE
jgi:hypothetical protein